MSTQNPIKIKNNDNDNHNNNKYVFFAKDSMHSGARDMDLSRDCKQRRWVGSTQSQQFTHVPRTAQKVRPIEQLPILNV